MTRFRMSEKELYNVKEVVTTRTGVCEPVKSIKFILNCAAYGNCGCGPGGTCASSCVSGCAERGGCGPHGPR